MIESRPSAGLPPWLSLLLIILFLGAGSWLTWWYIRGQASSQTIVLNNVPGPANLVPMAAAGGPRPPFRRRDAVVAGPNGSSQINAGAYFVHVQPATRPSEQTAFVFRVRNLVARVTPPEFSLVRQGLRPGALRTRLALTAAQVRQIRSIAATQPAIRTGATNIMTLSTSQLAALQTHWSAYASSADAPRRIAAEDALTQYVRQIGDAMVSDQRNQETSTALAIRQVLTAQQMETFRQWMQTAATQPAMTPGRAGALRGATTRPAGVGRAALTTGPGL